MGVMYKLRTDGKPWNEPERFENVGWSQYEAIVESWGGGLRRHTYQHGNLELYVCEFPEQRIKVLMRLVAWQLSFELRKPIYSAGRLLLYSEQHQCAFDPDETFFFKHERLVRLDGGYQQGVHPPPELAIEVDVPKATLNRYELYPLYGVNEIWRHNGKRVEFLAFRGRYERLESSLVFPMLRPADVDRFVDMRGKVGDLEITEQLIEWIRANK